MAWPPSNGLMRAFCDSRRSSALFLLTLSASLRERL
jgi:hypothetical protein